MGEVDAATFFVSGQIAEMLRYFLPRGIERFEHNREGFGIKVGPFDEATRLHYSLLPRIVATPPGYNSGLVLIFREPHTEHFMCLPTSGTGVSGGSGTLAGWTLRSRPHAQQ